MRQEILIGVERRRRWSDKQKMRVLSEVGVDGATVSDVARRHDLTRQHLYQWRRWLRQRSPAGDRGVRFLPLERVDDETVPSGSCGVTRPGRVDILLRNGRSIGVTGDPPDALLARIIRIAEMA
ncbi:IS66-like element accessory protein TnpA [Brytella acorum]|uniref:IS66-like element accessory protein TnpA n=1 Tax=Brytella acorum TaxID=2959299 RepID=UPI0025ADEE80|nr:transposase [Brytella acorum]MDF3626257.1 transposase [Brytella acorum]